MKKRKYFSNTVFDFSQIGLYFINLNFCIQGHHNFFKRTAPYTMYDLTSNCMELEFFYWRLVTLKAKFKKKSDK